MDPMRTPPRRGEPRRDPPTQLFKLLANHAITPKRLRVLILKCRGHSDVEVAERLCKSHFTVRNQITEMVRLLGCPSRNHLFFWATDRRVHDLDVDAYEEWAAQRAEAVSS